MTLAGFTPSYCSSNYFSLEFNLLGSGFLTFKTWSQECGWREDLWLCALLSFGSEVVICGFGVIFLSIKTPALFNTLLKCIMCFSPCFCRESLPRAR